MKAGPLFPSGLARLGLNQNEREAGWNLRGVVFVGQIPFSCFVLLETVLLQNHFCLGLCDGALPWPRATQ